MLLTIYGHLPGYLHRWRICGLGRVMVRLHRILDIDRTPFLHSHPFHYISLVLRGGYDERVLGQDGALKLVKRKAGSIVFRRAGQLHRIDAVQGQCTTLFFTWSLPGGTMTQNWTLQRHAEVAAPVGYRDAPDGVYAVPDGFRKRFEGFWYALRASALDAQACTRVSIHQHLTEFSSATEN